jgi:hypothetical protein
LSGEVPSRRPSARERPREFSPDRTSISRGQQ